MGKKQKPGEKPVKAGEYLERGGKVSKPRKVTIEAGDDKLPPTQKPNRLWERVSPPKP